MSWAIVIEQTAVARASLGKTASMPIPSLSSSVNGDADVSYPKGPVRITQADTCKALTQ